MIGERKRSLRELVEFCKETKWQDEPLLNNPLLRHRLAELAIDMETGLAQAKHILWGQYKVFMGEESSVEQGIRSSSAKYYNTELGERFALTALQIMGLYGQLKQDSKWAPMAGRFEREYQSAPGSSLGGGSTEIQKNIIAWSLGLPRM